MGKSDCFDKYSIINRSVTIFSSIWWILSPCVDIDCSCKYLFVAFITVCDGDGVGDGASICIPFHIAPDHYMLIQTQKQRDTVFFDEFNFGIK